MSIDLTTYGKRDQKVIRENPGKDVYALKELGLTDKGFERLLADGYDGTLPESVADIDTQTADNKENVVAHTVKVEAQNTSNVVKPTVQKVDTLPKPVLSEPQRVMVSGGNIRVKNVKTGKIVAMKPKAAQRLLKFHKEFQQV